MLFDDARESNVKHVFLNNVYVEAFLKRRFGNMESCFLSFLRKVHRVNEETADNQNGMNMKFNAEGNHITENARVAEVTFGLMFRARVRMVEARVKCTRRISRRGDDQRVSSRNTQRDYEELPSSLHGFWKEVSDSWLPELVVCIQNLKQNRRKASGDTGRVRSHTSVMSKRHAFCVIFYI